MWCSKLFCSSPDDQSNFLNMTLQVKFKINFPNEINGENKVKMTLPERDGKKRWKLYRPFVSSVRGQMPAKSRTNFRIQHITAV